MNINSILATNATSSLSSYFPYILIIVAILAAICLMNWYKNKKAEDQYAEAMDKISVGSKVKTMFGVFGEIDEIKTVGNTKTIILKLYDGTKIEMDSRAIYSLDDRLENVNIKEQTTDMQS